MTEAPGPGSDIPFVQHDPDSPGWRDVLRHYIGDLVYGANDGVVTTFAVVSGVAGAGLSTLTIVILGIVNLLADGFSMGASNYLAIRSTAMAHLADRGRREPFHHACATSLSFIVVGAVPLLPFLVPGAADRAFGISLVASGISLFAVGALRSSVSTSGWLRCGIEMFAVGMTAALVAYVAGAATAGLVRA